MNLAVGIAYLPFQLVHLGTLLTEASRNERPAEPWTLEQLAAGLGRSMRVKNPRTDAASWGGVVGLVWMTGYWATLLPAWMYWIVVTLADD